MGYYVRIVHSDARIPAANLRRAYDKMCALDVTHDDKKRGGSWERGKQISKWFSWMDADYTTKCKDARDILEMLGFECSYDTNGDLLIENYDSKTGQEDLFMEAIRTETCGTIDWVGEEGDRWTTEFLGDLVIDAEQPTRLLGN